MHSEICSKLTLQEALTVFKDLEYAEATGEFPESFTRSLIEKFADGQPFITAYIGFSHVFYRKFATIYFNNLKNSREITY